MTAPEPSGAHRDFVSGAVAPRIEALLRAAEQEAARLSVEVQSKAAQRAVEVVAAAHADAAALRAEASRRVDEYLAARRQEIDRYASEQRARLADLSERLIEAGEAIHDRLHDAIGIRDELHAVITVIGTVSEAVAAQAATPPPVLARPPAEVAPDPRPALRRAFASVAAEESAP